MQVSCGSFLCVDRRQWGNSHDGNDRFLHEQTAQHHPGQPPGEREPHRHRAGRGQQAGALVTGWVLSARLLLVPAPCLWHLFCCWGLCWSPDCTIQRLSSSKLQEQVVLMKVKLGWKDSTALKGSEIPFSSRSLCICIRWIRVLTEW